ncbi:MAG: bifunctional lysine ketoglutarate reductase /saccharopine dehydrogenase family protein [Acidobacteriota bacterium]
MNDRSRSKVVGIRLEDKSRWERRVPLVPRDLAALERDHGLRFVVQPSPIRVYGDDDYRASGATVQDDLSEAGVVFSVKEVPMDKLLPGRTYAFFAHVIKGQPYNMPLLKRLLDLGITLIDYERITDRQGHRLVKFGHEAGQAGMIDTLWTLGRRLASAGYPNPFSGLKQAYEYHDLAAAMAAIRTAGEALAAGYDFGPGGPLVVGFTGRGSVSQGAQEIFDLLPHETVLPEDLKRVVQRRRRDRIFKVVFEKHHLARPTDPTRTFVEAEYHQHPERFRERLSEFLPYLGVLVNGIYWTEAYPRFVRRETVDTLWREGRRRLKVIGDVTCDIDGAVELTYKATQPDHPVYTYDPTSGTFTDGLEGPGIAILAVDNLPCELPRDASDHFSHALRDFVPAIAAADYDVPFEDLDLPSEILAAVVTHRGKLAPEYRYLRQHLDDAGL